MRLKFLGSIVVVAAVLVGMGGLVKASSFSAELGTNVYKDVAHLVGPDAAVVLNKEVLPLLRNRAHAAFIYCLTLSPRYECYGVKADEDQNLGYLKSQIAQDPSSHLIMEGYPVEEYISRIKDYFRSSNVWEVSGQSWFLIKCNDLNSNRLACDVSDVHL